VERARAVQRKRFAGDTGSTVFANARMSARQLQTHCAIAPEAKTLLGAAIAPSLGATFATFAPAVTIPSIVISLAISLAIGLVADGYPANRAARLRPIEALRYQ